MSVQYITLGIDTDCDLSALNGVALDLPPAVGRAVLAALAGLTLDADRQALARLRPLLEALGLQEAAA